MMVARNVITMTNRRISLTHPMKMMIQMTMMIQRTKMIPMTKIILRMKGMRRIILPTVSNSILFFIDLSERV
jgi:hypothetical protein